MYSLASKNVSDLLQVTLPRSMSLKVVHPSQMGRRKARHRAKTSMDLGSWYLDAFYCAVYISDLTFLCGKTITRGYTDEADRLLNYLVYASQFPSFIFLTTLSRNMEYLMLSRNVTSEVSSLGFISSVPPLP
jgi:hypothetical protein